MDWLGREEQGPPISIVLQTDHSKTPFPAGFLFRKQPRTAAVCFIEQRIYVGICDGEMSDGDGQAQSTAALLPCLSTPLLFACCFVLHQPSSQPFAKAGLQTPQLAAGC